MKLNWFNSLLVIAALGIGCQKSKPTFEYMPDMIDSPAIKGQEYNERLPDHRGMLLPPEGSVPLGFQPYAYAGDEEGAAENLTNPLAFNRANLAEGKRIYNIYCIVCHGPRGLGDGSVVPPFPKPPSLVSDKIRDWEEGRVYHLITEGRGNMPSYASQIRREERWAAIHYLRAIQRAEKPTAEDVKAYKESLKK